MLIFNADDYGLTDIDSKRILKSMEFGIIRSTTIVSNFAGKKDLEKLRNIGNVSTGIHINLVEGKPLGTYTTLSNNKTFLSKKEFIKKLFFNKIDRNEIVKEISLQIEKLLDNGIIISHIDTHQNMHFLPKLLNIIQDVASKYQIKKIRGLNSEYFWFKDYSRSRALIKNSISTTFNNKYLKRSKYSQKIILNAPGLGFECNSIDKALELWDNGLKDNYKSDIIYEVPCHLYLSEFEFKLYNSKDFLDILNNYNIEIGNFNDI